MEFVATAIPGLFVIQPPILSDDRGSFSKIFHAQEFAKNGLEFEFREFFYSFSGRGVLRGMHFQVPPHEHSKLVFVTGGRARDVILDLRYGSQMFGKAISVELSHANHQAVYIPRGCAHGFLALEDSVCVNYLQTSVHVPEADQGIRYDSFGFDWSWQGRLVLSKRDKRFPALRDFVTPFVYSE